MIYIRESGSEIELKDTEKMKALAESKGWKLKGKKKIKKAQDKEAAKDNGESE